MASCYLPGPACPQVPSDLDERCFHAKLIASLCSQTNAQEHRTVPLRGDLHVSRSRTFASMKKLLIVFHSKTGGARQMAESAAKGAASEPVVHVNLIHASKAGPDELLEADGYIFATPENLAMMSGMMKDFFDRTYYAVLDRIVGRPYAILICAGSDGENAARQIQRIAAGWRLRAIAEPIIVCTHAQTAEAILAPKQIGAFDLNRCEEMGATLAAGLVLGIY
jgi:flavodoxin